MIQERPAKAPSRHPFLALSPEARRHLARVLVHGLEEAQDAELSRQTRAGLAGGGALTLVGAGLYQGWYHLTGLDAGPFALWYSLYLGVQAGIAHHLVSRGHGLGPQGLRWLLLAPAEAAAAARTWLFPVRLRPDRLVLAGGILVAIRHPISYHLLRRLYGRAYPQIEVDRAIALLRHLGLVLQKTREGSTVLLLAPAGVQLLHELGVPDPEPRKRHDPAIAPHLHPIFATLEQGRARHATPLRDAPDSPVLPHLPVAPPPPPPPIEVVVPQPEPEEHLPWDTEPEPEPEPVHPEPVSLPSLPEEVEEADEALAPEPVRRQPFRLPRIPARVLVGAAAVAAVGILAVIAARFWPQGPGPHPVTLTSAVMPSSQGTALQFNGRGMMLSFYRGDLFLSIADRLDYKRPVSFDGFDKASTCSLKAGAIKAASMSPQGRFLWLDLGTHGRGPERCLVDMETKTITHDLAAKNKAYGLPALVGWAGESTLVMSEETSSHQADRWWLLDVTTHQGTPLELPHHGRVMLLPMPSGGPLLVGLDMKHLGSWDLTTYWLDDQHQWQKLQALHTEFPEALREAEPIHAAVSPDKRYLLFTLKPVRPDAGTPGSLVVVSLADGTATAMSGTVKPEDPAFWGPEVRGGRYTFFYNAQTPDGETPWTGELLADK